MGNYLFRSGRNLNAKQKNTSRLSEMLTRSNAVETNRFETSLKKKKNKNEYGQVRVSDFLDRSSGTITTVKNNSGVSNVRTTIDTKSLLFFGAHVGSLCNFAILFPTPVSYGRLRDITPRVTVYLYPSPKSF